MAEEIVFSLENDADAGRRRSESLDALAWDSLPSMPRRRGSASNLTAGQGVQAHGEGSEAFTAAVSLVLKRYGWSLSQMLRLHPA